MQKILGKFKRPDRRDATSKFEHVFLFCLTKKDTADENITIQQVFHYRKQKGINLGTFDPTPRVHRA